MPRRLRDRLRNTNGASGSSSDYYYFKEGITKIRVLPTTTKDEDFFRESSEHFVNRATPPCPRKANEPYPCPICEKGESLYSQKGEENIEAARQLQPRGYFYFPALIFSSPDDKDPKDGPVIIRCGIKIIRQLLELDEPSSGWGNLTDFEKGFNVAVSRKKTGNDVREVDYNVTPTKPSQTLAEELDDFGVDLKSIVVPDVDAFVEGRFKSTEELASLLENVQTTPGFPGGPRTQVPATPAETPAPPTVQVEDGGFDLDGDVPAPPTVES